MIFLYNGKPTKDFIENYANVAQMLDQRKRTQVNGEINCDTLVQTFYQRIEGIVGTVRDKLSDDAAKDGLVQELTETVPTEDPNQKKMVKTLVAKPYRDYYTKFDEILSAVGDYFDLFKNNTNKLEDLWLQLLDYLKLKNTKKTLVFRQMHYSIYIKVVIKNASI